MAFEWTNDEDVRLRLDDDGILWILADDADAYSGIGEAVATLEVYRKALEPFLDRLPLWLEEGAANGRPEAAWFEGSLTPEHTADLRHACRLMGIPLAADPGDAP